MVGELTVRPYVPGQDDEVWVSIYNRARAAAPEFVPTTVEQFQRAQQAPWFSVNGRFVAELGNAPVGTAAADFRPEDGLDVGSIEGPHVVPEVRRRGVGAALLKLALESLRELGASRAESGAGDWNTAALAFLRKHGFQPAHTYSLMERDLTPVSGVGENREVELRPFTQSDEDIGLLYRLMSAAYAEYYNFAMGTLDEFRHIVRRQQEDGRHVERCFALDRGLPAGYVVVAVDPTRNRQLGRRQGEVYTIGVLKENRGRGIATRLLIHTLDRLRALGMESAVLSVDDQNVTNARRVYERVGFRVTRRFTSFELALAAPAKTSH